MAPVSMSTPALLLWQTIQISQQHLHTQIQPHQVLTVLTLGFKKKKNLDLPVRGLKVHVKTKQTKINKWKVFWDSGFHDYIVIENITWVKLRELVQALLTQTWFKLLSLQHVCFSLSRLRFTLNWNFAIWKQRHTEVASLTSTRANSQRGSALLPYPSQSHFEQWQWVWSCKQN